MHSSRYFTRNLFSHFILSYCVIVYLNITFVVYLSALSPLVLLKILILVPFCWRSFCEVTSRCTVPVVIPAWGFRLVRHSMSCPTVALSVQVLDLLFQYGYSPEQISLFPRVLSSSVGRLQRRLDALRNLGQQLLSCHTHSFCQMATVPIPKQGQPKPLVRNFSKGALPQTGEGKKLIFPHYGNW